MYTWGIFLAYIRRRLSSRLRFRVFWEAGRDTLHDGDYKWLRQIGDKRFFLPNMERMYPLSYLQHMSVYRTMEWDLSRFVSDMSLGRLGAKEVYSAGQGKDVFGLFPELVRPEYPKGETP